MLQKLFACMDNIRKLTAYRAGRKTRCVQIIKCNRQYSYSHGWTGNSLQSRLMRGNIIKDICI